MNVNAKSPLRRLLAMLLCIAMLMSIVVVPVSAAGPAEIISFFTSGDAEQLAPETAPEETVEVTEAETEAPTETPVVEDENVETVTVESDAPETLAANGAIGVVTADEVPGVTVKMFNYDSGINSIGLSAKGYKFHNGTASWVAKDGYGSDYKQGTLNTPNVTPTLKNGYPYVDDTDSNETKVTGSMDYLFGETYDDNGTTKTNTYYVGSATNGGGLFQEGGEGDVDFYGNSLNGYYYYDSMLNSAYYDSTANKFTLYDTIVRPQYTAQTNSAAPVAISNFLPFNQVNNAILDESAWTSSDGKTLKTAQLGDIVDLWFGMTVEFDFFMPKNGQMNGEDMVFDFYGDDDVFVYIDDVLILDIVGTHAAKAGTINFNTGKVTDEVSGDSTLYDLFEKAGKADSVEWVETEDGGKTFKDYSDHTLKFFYMERGGNISYCRLKFNMPILPENSLTVTKVLEAEEDVNADAKEFIENTVNYQFRVWKSDENGNSTKVPLIKTGDTYAILENGTAVGTGTVGADNIFTLKAGQSAQFEKMTARGGDDVNYIVEEIIPAELTGQYGSVEYTYKGTDGNTVNNSTNTQTAFTSVTTGVLLTDQTQTVTFTNRVDTDKLGVLKVTKAAAANTTSPAGAEFQIQVKLDGKVLEEGTEFTVGSETKAVDANGILKLKVGETATLVKGILSGTTYEITEINHDGYTASYSGTVTVGETATAATVTDGVVSGEFPVASTVAVTVTNTPTAQPDAVVIDYGLPVDVDVLSNDGLATPSAFAITGVTTSETKDTLHGDASFKNDTNNIEKGKVRYTPDDMQMDNTDVFTYTASNGASTITSTLTVIPATTIYYEDNFMTYETSGTAKWEDSATPTAVQAENRPGAEQVATDKDKNNYGYDAAYSNMSQFSMGSAKKITVSKTLKKDSTSEYDMNSGRASFTFWGTGFDVISMTSNKTGMIIVDVYKDADHNNPVKSLVVDTYYGYTYQNGEWVTTTSDNALYQVPVMEVEGLDYGKYYVTITASYDRVFNHEQYGEEMQYDFYLDAIRIYDPANDGATNNTIKDAYIADGEYKPEYVELRNSVIAANTVSVTLNSDGTFTVKLLEQTDEDGTTTEVTTLPGAVFVDGVGKTASISDYVSYGPNNELYLDNGQSIAFKVNMSKKDGMDVADVQIGIKSAECIKSTEDTNEPIPVTYTIDGTEKTVATATDMYYSIKDYVDGGIIIKNTSDGILSLTNIKVTYTPGTQTASEEVVTLASDGAEDEPVGLIYVDTEVVNSVLMCSAPEDDSTTETEPTEPEVEETVPETEATEPEVEETVPETEATEPEVEETVPETEVTEPEIEETEPEVTEPETEENTSSSESFFSKLIDAIGKLFGKWFR